MVDSEDTQTSFQSLVVLETVPPLPPPPIIDDEERYEIPKNLNLIVLTRTETPLGISATFQSDILRVDRFGRIVGQIFTDANCTLSCDQSADGINWDYTHPAVTVKINEGNQFAFDVIAKYARVRIANGATAQNILRCCVYGRVNT